MKNKRMKIARIEKDFSQRPAYSDTQLQRRIKFSCLNHPDGLSRYSNRLRQLFLGKTLDELFWEEEDEE